MKRKNRFALVLGCAAVLGLAVASPAEAGRIADRQARQQDRVAQGTASGRLTARETARLESREAALHRSVARMRSDGGLSGNERLRIGKRQDRISLAIARQKHDGQTR